MYQIPIETINPRTCAITGHRNLPPDLQRSKIKDRLCALIEAGVEIFYNGLAIGFDLLTAELILQLKKDYPSIRLCGCVPFYGQEKYYNAEDAALYRKIYSSCDEIVILDEEYHKNSYFKRNDYMIDHADLLFAFCKDSHGGSAYTVRNFIKKKGAENVIYVE